MPESAEMTVASDEDIITATLRGDIASFGAIVERHWNMVVVLALSRIADLAKKSLPPIAGARGLKRTLIAVVLLSAYECAGWWLR